MVKCNILTYKYNTFLNFFFLVQVYLKVSSLKIDFPLKNNTLRDRFFFLNAPRKRRKLLHSRRGLISAAGRKFIMLRVLS